MFIVTQCFYRAGIPYLQAEEAGKEPPAFGQAEEGRREGGPQQEALEVPNRPVVLEIQQWQSGAQGVASFHISGLACRGLTASPAQSSDFRIMLCERPIRLRGTHHEPCS